MRPRRMLAISLIVCGIAVLGSGLASAQPTDVDEPGPIDIVEIEGLIDPPMARYIALRLEMAESDGAQAVVLRFDSPASVGIDDDALIATVADAGVPVIAWVAPRGAVAHGLAGDLVFAADAAYRAAQTTIEARSNGGPIAPSIERASSLSDLLIALDGRTVEVQALDGTTIDGTMIDRTTIESWDTERGFPGVLLRFHGIGLWDRLLHAVTTPTAALFLILLGTFGLIFEIYNPGIGIAAALGAVLLGLGFYALDVLPTNWLALLVIFGAIAALVYDVHVAGFGLGTIGGVAAMIVGAALLFPGGVPALDVGLGTIVGAAAMTIVFFVSVMTAALRVRLRRPISDSEGIIGAIAEAQTDIAPEGTVLTNGTLWRARTMEVGIAAGAKVEVKATEGLVLLVEPLHEE